MKLVAVIGRSGSGKTTFLCALIAALKRRGFSSAVIKHCGSGFDLGGKDKDSSRFLRAGAAEVALAGPRGTAVLRSPRRRPRDRDLARSLAGADFVFIEGGSADQGIPSIEIIGLDPGHRAPLRDADRRLIVARSPVEASSPIFSPGRAEEVASLLVSDAAKEASAGRSKLEEDFFRAHDPAIRGILRDAVVAVAGAGGLGSNVAVALARAGVGTLLLADFDRVEPDNLNRQQFFSDQIGRSKVAALAENLRRIPSGTRVVARKIRITRDNVARLFGKAVILVEAFDRAEEKQMLIETWMTRFPDRPVVAASGLAGFGANNRIRERRVGLLTLIGDEESEPAGRISPMAPRVAAVAAMQATRVIELLVKTSRAAKK